MTNVAAWIPSKGAAVQIGAAAIPQPGPLELVIEVGISHLAYIDE